MAHRLQHLKAGLTPLFTMNRFRADFSAMVFGDLLDKAASGPAPRLFRTTR